MSENHLLIWNARGINSRARRNVIRTVVSQQRASIVCIQEMKVHDLSNAMNTECTGFDYDYAFLPAVGAAGGASTSWRRDLWEVSSFARRRFSVTVSLSSPTLQASWWLTNVYGPVLRPHKPAFLHELRDIRAACAGAWLLCGDFNLICNAADKNNGRLHRGLMRAFRDTLDSL